MLLVSVPPCVFLASSITCSSAKMPPFGAWRTFEHFRMHVRMSATVAAACKRRHVDGAHERPGPLLRHTQDEEHLIQTDNWKQYFLHTHESESCTRKWKGCIETPPFLGTSMPLRVKWMMQRSNLFQRVHRPARKWTRNR